MIVAQVFGTFSDIVDPTSVVSEILKEVFPETPFLVQRFPVEHQFTRGVNPDAHFVILRSTVLWDQRLAHLAGERIEQRLPEAIVEIEKDGIWLPRF